MRVLSRNARITNTYPLTKCTYLLFLSNSFLLVGIYYRKLEVMAKRYQSNQITYVFLHTRNLDLMDISWPLPLVFNMSTNTEHIYYRYDLLFHQIHCLICEIISCRVNEKVKTLCCNMRRCVVCVVQCP